MEVVFLGVGEACDERYPNTSILIRSEKDSERLSVLLDCGFSVPGNYWRLAGDQEELDALWISHFHGDHFFGVPSLLLWFRENQRRRPLLILGQEGVAKKVAYTVELAYPGFLKKLGYALEFIEVEPGLEVNAAGFTWRSAEVDHSTRNLGLRIDDGERSVYYSGDGVPTTQALALVRGCDLAVHEAYYISDASPGHGNVQGCMDFAWEAKLPRLALVHLKREVRFNFYDDIMNLLTSINEFQILLPEPGDVLEL